MEVVGIFSGESVEWEVKMPRLRGEEWVRRYWN